MKKLLFLIAAGAWACPAGALDPMAREPGFSGFINVGVGFGRFESNFLAGVPGLAIDFDQETIDSFGAPGGENFIAPSLAFNLNYTLANLRTQLSLGNDLADFLQFDRSTLMSVRHDVDGVGRFQLSLVTTPLLVSEVWEDPYVLGVPRRETERTVGGPRFTWDRMFGSPFELRIEPREIDLDDERSGEWLGLAPEQRALLDRRGDVRRIELGYLWVLDQGRNVLRPGVTWIDRDLDGRAMAQDGYELGLAWLHNPGGSFRLASNVTFQSHDGDAVNPIFDERNDATAFFAASQAFFPGLFGWTQWEPSVTVLWSDSNSDIQFNDTAGWLASVSVGRRF